MPLAQLKEKFFLLCILLCLSLSGFAQKSMYFNDRALHTFVDSLNVLAETNPNRSFHLLDSVQQHVPEEELPLFLVKSHYIKGCGYRNLENFEKLTFHFEKTKKLAQEHGYRQMLAEVYREMGDQYIDSDLYKKAIESYDKAKEVYREFGNEQGEILCIYDGFIENLQGKHEESNTILKSLLPTFKKAHPVYLDALSTIAQNYLQLKNIDSAFAYVNKMPLHIDNINNSNYSLHKYYVSVLYYIEKKQPVKATHFNNLIGKSRFNEEMDIHYFQNKINIARLEKDTPTIEKFTDSLNIAYQKRIRAVEKAEVYTTEKFLATEKVVEQQKSSFFIRVTILVTIAILLLLALIFGYRKYKSNQKYQEKVIVDMKNEIQNLIQELQEKEQVATDPNTDVATKIMNLSKQYDLTERETDVLFHMTKGLNNKEIAEELFVSVNTVKYHIRNLYEKLNVSKRGEIASKLIE